MLWEPSYGIVSYRLICGEKLTRSRKGDFDYWLDIKGHDTELGPSLDHLKGRRGDSTHIELRVFPLQYPGKKGQ